MSNELNLLSNYITNHRTNVSEFLEQFDEKQIAIFLGSIPTELAAHLLCDMEKFTAAKSITHLDAKIAAEILEKVPFPISEMLFRLISDELKDTLLNELQPRISKPLKQALSFSQNKVGAYIDPFTIVFKKDTTIGQALKKIKKANPDQLPYIFVIDDKHQLTGGIDLKQLILAGLEEKVHSIMDENPQSVNANTDISALTNKTNWTNKYSSYPVINNEGIFLGTISKDTIDKLSGIDTKANTHLLETGLALGELYKIGFSGIFRGIATMNSKTISER